MSDIQTDTQEIRALVNSGLFVDNLYKLERKCGDLLRSGQRPVVFFTLQTVFFDLRMFWEDRPLLTQDYEAARARLTPPLLSVLSSLEADESDSQVYQKLNALVQDFLALREG
jgi:hypothetical protein